MRFIITFCLICTVALLQAQNRIGINTPIPAAILDVHDPSFSTLLISTNGYSADTSSLILRNMIGNTTGTEFIFESRREEGLLLRSNSDLASNTNSEIMLIKPDGEIGIGHSNPEELLHLHNETINQALIKFTTGMTGSGPTSGFTLGVIPSGTARFTQRSKENISFATDFQTRMVIDSLGMISIGGHPPSNFLMLKHNSDANTYGVDIVNNGNGDAGIYLLASNWFGIGLQRSSQLLRIGKGSTPGSIDDIVVNQSGLVGIGTTSMEQKLHVGGKLRIGNDSRPPTPGTMRYNTTTGSFEGWDGSDWKSFNNKRSSSFTQPSGFWSSDPDFSIAIDKATINDTNTPASPIIAHVDVPDSAFVTHFKVCMSIENIVTLDSTEVSIVLLETELDGTNTIVHSGTIEFLVLGPLGNQTICQSFELATPQLVDHGKLYRIACTPLYIPGLPVPLEANSWSNGNLSVRNASIYYVH